MNEMVGEIFIQELAEGQLLDLGEGVNGPERGHCTIFQFDLVVIRATWWECRTFALTKYIHKLMVSFWKSLMKGIVFLSRGIGLGGDGGVSGDGGGVDKTGVKDRRGVGAREPTQEANSGS